MKILLTELDCPDCDTTVELEEGLDYESGDIIECPDCDHAWLVEEDGTLTPGYTEEDPIEDDDGEEDEEGDDEEDEEDDDEED